MDRAHLPFWLALFIGNVVSVMLLSFVVPWASTRFAWWLQPKEEGGWRLEIAGIIAVSVGYLACLGIFSQL